MSEVSTLNNYQQQLTLSYHIYKMHIISKMVRKS